MTADAEFELKAVGDKQVADALQKITKKLAELEEASKKAAGATDILGNSSKKAAEGAKQAADAAGKAAGAQGKLGESAKSAALSIGVQVAAIASTSVAIGRASPALAQLSQTIAMTAANATALGTVFGPIGVGVAALLATLPSLIHYLTAESEEFDSLSDSIDKASHSLTDFITQAARSAAARDQLSRIREGAGTSGEYAGLQAQQRAILAARNRQLALSMGDANAAAQSAIANANAGNIGRVVSAQAAAGNLDESRMSGIVQAFRRRLEVTNQVSLATKRLADAETHEHNLALEQQIKESNTRDAALRHREAAEGAAAARRREAQERENVAFLNANNEKDRAYSEAVLRASRELQTRLQSEREHENDKFRAIAEEEGRVSQEQNEQRRNKAEEFRRKVGEDRQLDLQKQKEEIEGATTQVSELLIGAFKAAKSEHKALAVAIKDSLDTWLASFAEQELLKAGSLAAEAIASIFIAPAAVGPLFAASAEHLALAAAAGGASAAIPNGGGRGGGGASSRPEDASGTKSIGSANSGPKNVYISINSPIHTEAESGRMVSQLLKAAQREGYNA